MREQAQQFDPRQNMLTHSFEVFHYKDACLDPVAMHHHDFFEVYLFLSGRVEYRVEGRTYCLAPGDLLLISPLELHQPIVEASQKPYERIVLWINRGFLESFATERATLTRCFDSTQPNHTNLLRLTSAQRTAVTAQMGKLVRESYVIEYGSSQYALGIFLQLMVEINRMALLTVKDCSIQDGPPELVAQLLEYIGEHFCDELSLDTLAERFYVSKYHLSHTFQSAVGTSVYRYIILKRLLMAKQMLAGGIPAGVVCRSCGFKDYANFFRAFKSEYGISPKAYVEMNFHAP